MILRMHGIGKQEQARNKTSNVMLTYNGKTRCLSAWAEEIGAKKNVLSERLAAGWSVEEALGRPIRVRRWKTRPVESSFVVQGSGVTAS